MKSTGFASVRTSLRSIGRRVPEAARKAMHRASVRIVKRAQLYVPEDTEALKNSIRIERSYGDRGRLQIDIVAGDAKTVRSGKEIDINQYAWIIHEHYGRMKPGGKTLAKQAANPSILVGERFMTRAARDEEQGLRNLLVQSVTSIIIREKMV